MARSGYLLDDLLVGRGLELVGGHVAKGAVQAGAVVPGDVLHGRVAGGGAGGPGLVVEALTFQGGEERLGERVVPALAGAAGRQADREILGEGGVVAAGVLGGFNWSSQHLHGEELRWEHGDRGRAWRAGYRCAHLVGRRWRGVSIGNGSGRRSRTGCPARTPPWCVAYRRRWGRGGSGRVAACHQPVWLRCRAATCRSPSEKRSPSSPPKAVACARSLAGWAVQRRPSRERSAATPRPVAGCWSIAPRPRSGTPIGVPSARSWPSSPATTRSGSTCRTGSPAGSPRPTARRCPVPRFAGSGAGTGAARTEGGPGRGCPEQIANRLRVDFPDDGSMRISHEAIYQALYVQGRGALRRELTACLRTGRALRVPRARTRGRGKKFVTAEILISERPAEAADRAVPGHWE